jgi:uncharacterized protein (TIGR00645 family)
MIRQAPPREYDGVSGKPHGCAERLVERTIFASRWLLAPFYLGLAVSLVVLLIKLARRLSSLLYTLSFPAAVTLFRSFCL